MSAPKPLQSKYIHFKQEGKVVATRLERFENGWTIRSVVVDELVYPPNRERTFPTAEAAEDVVRDIVSAGR